MADLQALLEKLSASKAGQTAGALLKGGSVDHLDWPDYAKTTVRQTRAYLPQPANPATPSAGWNQGVRDTLHGMFVEPVQQAGKALRGQLTEGEAQNFALEAAAGLIPMGRGLKAAKTGIKAYHGSPHDFDRFDISKIGTGEGAQAYGHGLYFAEAEPVARQYRDALSAGRMDSPEDVAHLYHKTFSDTAIPMLRENAQTFKAGDAIDRDTLLRAADLLEKGHKPKSPGRMYEVNINAHPDQFLDWDKPLSKQPDVQRAIGQVAPQIAAEDIPGQLAYYRLANRKLQSPDASAKLAEAGIPGIKYFDQSSRHASTSAPLLEADIAAAKAKGQPHIAEFLQQQLDSIPKPTSNYVVFDDKMIDILRKYGIAGLGVGGALGAGSIPKAEAEPLKLTVRPE